MSKFRLSAEAAGDITEIFDYIGDDSIDAAQRIRAEIYEEITRPASGLRSGLGPILFTLWGRPSPFVVCHPFREAGRRHEPIVCPTEDSK